MSGYGKFPFSSGLLPTLLLLPTHLPSSTSQIDESSGQSESAEHVSRKKYENKLVMVRRLLLHFILHFKTHGNYNNTCLTASIIIAIRIGGRTISVEHTL